RRVVCVVASASHPPLRYSCLFLLCLPRSRSTLFPYTTLFRSARVAWLHVTHTCEDIGTFLPRRLRDRGSGDVHADVQTFRGIGRSEEHTSELQSRFDLVCRLLLEKKNKKQLQHHTSHPSHAPI